MTLKYFSSFLLCFASAYSFAQKPEQIYSIVHVIKPNAFYREQTTLWKREVEKNKSNANAWYNYYKANRYAQISSGTDSITSPTRFESIADVVKEIEANIPNSYEAHLIRWSNGNNNWKLLPELQKAYELDSSRTETYSGFVNFYEVNRDIVKRDLFLQKWYGSGEASPGLLYYNYNVLKSLKPNAILITAGDNDTYFAWMLQAVWGIRKDVLIVNIGLASIRKYAERLSGELGIALPDATTLPYTDYVNGFYNTLLDNKTKRPVYAALTVGEDVLKPVEKNLYLVGLAYEYSDEKIDNIALLKKNLEKEYALDYLDNNFSIDTYQTVVDLANSNYVVPMLTLYRHYKLSGDTERANLWKEKAKTAARKGGQGEEMKDYFKE